MNVELINKIIYSLKKGLFPGNVPKKGVYISWGIGIQVYRDSPLRHCDFSFILGFQKMAKLAVDHAKMISDKPYDDGNGEGIYHPDGLNYGDGGPPQFVLDFIGGDKWKITLDLYNRDANTKTYITNLSESSVVSYLNELLKTDIRIYDLNLRNVRKLI